MTLDARARATALKLLTKFGKACSLNKITVGVYNPETGTVANTTASHSIQVYLDAPNSQDLAGGQIVTTDAIALFAASGLSVEPAPNDTITVDGANRTIKTVGRVWSGEQVALWRCAVAS